MKLIFNDAMQFILGEKKKKSLNTYRACFFLKVLNFLKFGGRGVVPSKVSKISIKF